MIDEDVRRARTLPLDVYGSAAWARLCESMLARTWHVVEEELDPPARGSARPLTLLPGSLDEPLVVTCDEAGEVSLLSNVCTHRANLVVTAPCAATALRCRYHGRRFRLDGRFASMPGFEGAEGFPGPEDDLPRVAAATWGPLRFASLAPAHPFEDLARPLLDRLAVIDLARAARAEVRHYDVAASFLLYVDNYLEGLHIPFVHPGLLEAVDTSSYRTELAPLGTLQIAEARAGQPAFTPPPGHPDHGRRIAAYYAWLFPCTMINAYPWGLSVNVVRPQGPDRTRVTFASFVVDEALRDRGAGGDLHRVELEDEAIVEAVQRGVRSRLARPGRFSPSHEAGVHHFHRLVEEHLVERTSA